MKKVILCLLLLIPILVILTIDASGKLIASALVDIPVESIVIKRGGQVLESDEVYLEDYKDTGKKYTVFCEVFPGIATDEMLWESSNTQIATITTDEKRKDAADIHFHDYGSVDILCTSKKNSSISARATLYVGGLIPGYMTMGDYAGNTFDKLTVGRYTTLNLLAAVKPARSVKEEKIAWSTTNADIVKVDNNGVITAKSHGQATVSASVTAKGKTVSASVLVTVAGDALSTQSAIYCSDNSVNLAPYKTDDQVVVEGGEDVDLSALGEFESVEVVFRKGDETQKVNVTRVPAQKSLVIENYYALKNGALSAFIALGTSNIELNAIALDGGTPTVQWRSGNENVLVIRNNRLFAVGSGEADIYPYAEGYASQHITLNVTSPVEDFRLSETAYRDAVGLLQERVFGNRTYKNGNYTDTFVLKIASVYPVDASIEAFTFESTNSEIARVENNGVIHFASDVDGRDVTITATAYNQQGMPVRKHYTFQLVNGVNIAVDSGNQHFDAQAGEMPDFKPYYDLKAVASDRNVKAIVLHNDVYFPAKADGGEAILNLSASIYGNGRKLDGQFLIDSVEETDKLLLWNFEEYPDMPADLRVDLVNLNLQSTQPTSDDAQKAFEELSVKGGGAIGVLGAYPNTENHFALNAKGCLFQYAYGHVNTAIGDSVYDGCIFRNNSASAIVLQQSGYGVANAKIKNCIFSNTIAPVGIACSNFNDLLANMKRKKNDKIPPQFGTFELEGTNYVYNWKKLEDVQMNLLPQVKDSTARALVDSANTFLGKVIKQAFMASDKKNLYIDANGDEWLNFSFLMIGLWWNMNPQFNPTEPSTAGINVFFDPDKHTCAEVKAYNAPSVGDLGSFIRPLGIDLEQNKTYHITGRDKDGKFNTLPGETYTIDQETYAKLRGADK